MTMFINDKQYKIHILQRYFIPGHVIKKKLTFSQFFPFLCIIFIINIINSVLQYLVYYDENNIYSFI